MAGGDLKITDKLGLYTICGFGTLTLLYMNYFLIYYYRNVSNEKSDVSSKDDNKSKFDELKKRILEEKETFFYLVVDEGEVKISFRASLKFGTYTMVGSKTGRFSRQLISLSISIPQLILQTMVPNESS